MSKVYKNCLQIAIKRGDKTLAVKLSLIRNVESDQNGVFLDNAYADVRDFITPVEWRSALSILAKQGFYKSSQDPAFVGKFGYINPEA